MSSGGDDEIARFYDRHPYPPPVHDLKPFAQGWDDGMRRRVEHARLWPTLRYRDDHSILIAGCGTSQAAKFAVRYPNASVVGIDVSPASIDATLRLIDQHALTNVEVHQVAIENVGRLERSFDHIVSTGVLHHLAEPEVGLRSLRKVLTDEGAMQVMLYATYGRTGVYMLQEYCRRLGVQPVDSEIADLVATLRELPAGHPISHILRNTPDFQHDDALADALLNPRDRSYTVPEFLALVDAAGLRFDRWVRQASYRPQCGTLSEVPHGARIAAMAEHDQFAAVELFRGTMTRHSAVLHRDDSTLADPAIRWDDQAWPDHVPIRPTTVIVVDDRVPPGVAAALLNRAHTDRDLVLFVDDAEQAIFDAVDGHRSLGEIAGATPEFFERLWLHDLVVIDASACALPPMRG